MGVVAATHAKRRCFPSGHFVVYETRLWGKTENRKAQLLLLPSFFFFLHPPLLHSARRCNRRSPLAVRRKAMNLLWRGKGRLELSRSLAYTHMREGCRERAYVGPFSEKFNEFLGEAKLCSRRLKGGQRRRRRARRLYPIRLLHLLRENSAPPPPDTPYRVGVA